MQRDTRSVRALAAPWILSTGFENCMAPLSTPWLPRYLLEAAAGALSGCYRTRLLFRPLLDVAVPQHVGRGACTGASVEVRWIHWCALFLQLCYKGGNFQLHGFKTGKKLQKLSSGTLPSDVNSPSGTLYLFSDLRWRMCTCALETQLPSFKRQQSNLLQAKSVELLEAGILQTSRGAAITSQSSYLGGCFTPLCQHESSRSRAAG